MAGEVLVGDGAMGTMLLERVLQPGQSPEVATSTHPEVLAEIAGQYVAAGADLVETNTFGASPLKLALARLDLDASVLNREAVRIARTGAGGRAHVVASVGPSGRLLEPHGDTDPADVRDSFRTQLEHLIDEGVDAVFVETMVDLAEATLAIRAVKDLDADVPVAAMMTFDPTPRGLYTVMGVSVAAAVAGLTEVGADLLGSNCGNGVEQMIDIATEFRRHTELPLIIQPNAGLPHTREGRVEYDETPDMLASRARELLDIGVSVIGGCCGTTPDHIRSLRRMIDGRASNHP